MSREKRRQPVTLDTTLGHYPWVVLHFRCHYCARERKTRLAVLAIEYGLKMPLGGILREFVSGCPHDPFNPEFKRRKYGHHCGAYCPDVGSSRPPDLPPSMTGLTLIEGGKRDRLAAERIVKAHRRRVGGNDED